MSPNVSDGSTPRLSATLVSNVGGGSSRTINFDPGTTVGEVADVARISRNDNVARIDGNNAGWDKVLTGGERITFAPMKAAGAF